MLALPCLHWHIWSLWYERTVDLGLAVDDIEDVGLQGHHGLPEKASTGHYRSVVGAHG